MILEVEDSAKHRCCSLNKPQKMCMWCLDTVKRKNMTKNGAKWSLLAPKMAKLEPMAGGHAGEMGPCVRRTLRSGGSRGPGQEGRGRGRGEVALSLAGQCSLAPHFLCTVLCRPHICALATCPMPRIWAAGRADDAGLLAL